MIMYLLRRILYGLPILFGINLITFAIFFIINSPDDMARMHLGEKYIKSEAILQWKITHGYDLPLFYNKDALSYKKISETLFFQQSWRLFTFDFGVSDNGRNISYDIKKRMWPSLAIALPTLLLGMIADLVFALLMVFFRSTPLDLAGVVVCIVLMSISSLFYIIGGQYLFAKLLNLVPISGYASGLGSIKFVALPICVAILAGLGSGGRWYRGLLLEEIQRDYVKTARAKGLSEAKILVRHVLKNAMLPIITGIVVLIPFLFMGSLILESFFAIPGLGSYIIDAINQQDFAIVRSMVFLGSVLYILGLIFTDLAYTLVDPRVQFR